MSLLYKKLGVGDTLSGTNQFEIIKSVVDVTSDVTIGDTNNLVTAATFVANNFKSAIAKVYSARFVGNILLENGIIFTPTTFETNVPFGSSECSLYFTSTATGGGNCYTYWRIADSIGSYNIIAGDYLEYDIYCHPNNPVFDAFVEFDFMDGSYGRSYSILDQNGIAWYAGNIANYARGRWYHRKFNLSSVIGKTLKYVNVAEEGDIAGVYIDYFRKIIITNGINTRGILWNGGHPFPSMLNYSNLTSAQVVDGTYFVGIRTSDSIFSGRVIKAADTIISLKCVIGAAYGA
jgi:hypothetical protein